MGFKKRGRRKPAPKKKRYRIFCIVLTAGLQPGILDG